MAIEGSVARLFVLSSAPLSATLLWRALVSGGSQVLSLTLAFSFLSLDKREGNRHPASAEIRDVFLYCVR